MAAGAALNFGLECGENMAEQNVGVIVERLEDLRTDVKALSAKVDGMAQSREVRELSAKVDDMTREQAAFRVTYAAEHMRVVEASANANRRLDVIEPAVATLGREFQGMVAKFGVEISKIDAQTKLIVAAFSFLAVSIGGWLIAQILGLIR